MGAVIRKLVLSRETGLGTFYEIFMLVNVKKRKYFVDIYTNIWRTI